MRGPGVAVARQGRRPSEPRSGWISPRTGTIRTRSDAGSSDPRILAEVLSTLGELAHPEREAVGLRHAHHPSPYVRAEVPCLVFERSTWRTPQGAAKDALLMLAADEDPRVRREAGRALAVSSDGGSEFTDALVALLHDPLFEVRKGIAAGIEACGAEARPPVPVTARGVPRAHPA